MNYLGTGLSLVCCGLETGMQLPSIANVVDTDSLGGITGTYDYATVEATRNNANGTVAADISSGKSVKIRNVTITGTGSGGGGGSGGVNIPNGAI
jgi:hypothetical protein